MFRKRGEMKRWRRIDEVCRNTSLDNGPNQCMSFFDKMEQELVANGDPLSEAEKRYLTKKEAEYLGVTLDYDEFFSEVLRNHSNKAAHLISRVMSNIDLVMLGKKTLTEILREAKGVEDSPPRNIQFLLYLFLSKKNRDHIAGDLEEEFHGVIVPKLGIRRARFWYRWQALRTIGFSLTRLTVAIEILKRIAGG